MSPHTRLYSSVWPAMIPVFLLGSSVFLGLQLIQLKLEHEKYMFEATARVVALEAEVDALQQRRLSETVPGVATNNRKTIWKWW